MMVFSHIERFLVGMYNKLQHIKYGPNIISTKINDNVYIIDLLDNKSISRTFNMSHIYPFYDDQSLYPKLEDDLRSLLQVERLT